MRQRAAARAPRRAPTVLQPPPVTLREGAYAVLLALIADPTPAPLVRNGRTARFAACLRRRETPRMIAAELDLTLEEIAGGCIRVLRSTYRLK